jgi:two-component system sensor histidine kinase/response regulator
VAQNGLGSEERDSLRDVLRASQSMVRMVMNLLDVSRSEDGALVPRLGEFDLPLLLDEVCSEMSRRVEDKNQKLALSVGAEVQRLDADRDLVRRILENLIDNAYKYGPRHSTITVEAALAEGEGGATELEIRVRDQGEGIPPAFRSKIFEKYARVDGRAAHEVRNSHGLGLVFCRRAVDVHGGRIWVEENLPRGSCFHLRFRLRAAAGGTLSAGPSNGPVPPAMGSGERSSPSRTRSP